MNKIWNFYDNNKLVCKIGLGVLALILIILCFVVFLPKKTAEDPIIKKEDVYKLVLFGKEETTIYRDTEFEEPGYYALLNNDIVTELVTVNRDIDTSKLGTYHVTYKINDLQKVRIVKVIENPNQNIGEIVFSLIGNKEISLYIGDDYQELGAKAIDVSNNDISSMIKIDSDLNIYKAGNYTVTYTLNVMNEIKTLKRTIIIKDKVTLTAKKNTENYTNSNVLITLNGYGSEFYYLKMPNNVVSYKQTYTYTVSENGTYTFYAYDRNGKYDSKTVKVSNIDRNLPTGSCTATATSSKTEIRVSATDNLSGIAKYIYNGTYTSTSNAYTINSKLTSVKVAIYDNAGNVNTINCTVTVNDPVTPTNPTTPSKKDSLEIHFITSGHYDDAILIRTNDNVIMIDGGRSSCSKYVTPYLKELGVKTIDALIGSHVQDNHISAGADIMNNFTVKNAYYSVDVNTCASKGYCLAEDVKYINPVIKSKGIKTTVLGPKDTLTIGNMKLYFLGPVSLSSNQNSNSFVFILQFGNNKFMFTGDTGGSGMKVSTLNSYASAMGINIKVDVLKYPHHGNQSLTDEFLKAISPKYVIVPNYGASKYPSSTNKTKISNAGAKMYGLATYNNVVLLSDGETVTVKTQQKASTYAR